MTRYIVNVQVEVIASDVEQAKARAIVPYAEQRDGIVTASVMKATIRSA